MQIIQKIKGLFQPPEKPSMSVEIVDPELEERVVFDISKLNEIQLANLRQECLGLIINSKAFGTVIADRARQIRDHITLVSPDFEDVKLWRARLVELDSLVGEFRRLGKLPKEQKPLDPNNLFG
jgi:hypothetical protein